MSTPTRPAKGERKMTEIVIKREKNGRYSAKCPLGLWEVCGPDVQVVMREALHYWRSYAEGGEYDSTLTRPTGHSEV